MSREFWAIIGVGVSISTLIVGLGALMVTAHAGINARLDAMQVELHGRYRPAGRLHRRSPGQSTVPGREAMNALSSLVQDSRTL